MQKRRHIQGESRFTGFLLPQFIDDYVCEDNAVRVIEAFTVQLDLAELGFTKAELADVGRAPYDPADLLKLYIWGNMNRIRSSRRLEVETQRNLEVMWLLGKLSPDDKTIANFRKDNKKALKQVFVQFNLLCRGLGLFGGETVAIDGSCFAAANSKKRNFSRAKIERRLKELEEQAERYLQELEENDAAEQKLPKETVESIRKKIKWIEERLNEYGELKEELQEGGKEQISLTDSDSRLLVKNGRADVGYNTQLAVDEKHNMIATFAVTNDANDKEQLVPMAEAAKESLDVEELEVLADKGYCNPSQIAECEEKGITTYIPMLNTAKMHKGEVPTAAYGNDKFTYNRGSDTYTCPAGAVLKQGWGKNRRYRSRACSSCSSRSLCTTNKEGRIIERSQHAEVMERLKHRLARKPDKSKVRGQIVEPVFGVIKSGMDFLSFSLRGLEKVDGEFSMVALAYNMKRAIKILSVPGLVAAIYSGSG
jgi:transposase